MSTIRSEAIEPETLYDTQAYCAIFGISKAKAEFDRWKNKGPPFYRVGKKIHYKGRDMLALIEAGRVETNKAA